MCSFGAEHKEIHDQRCKVAMALATLAPHNRLQGQKSMDAFFERWTESRDPNISLNNLNNS